ncbi:unnamed protein product [Meganyctiphanes norvegica]|uniref:C-type lectin domain-containing protein n=1 Tax=Meganyctiphanes norvegica TaxID=48144 RepID=A0AAV2RVK0_MEGNR
MMLLSVVVGALVIAVVAGQGCPPPFVEAGGTCLYMGTDSMTWGDARDYCSTLAGEGITAHLATFPTCDEFALATYWLNINSSPDSDLWVGAVKASAPNNWLWITLEELQTGVPMWSYKEGHDDGMDCASMSKNFRHKLSCSFCEELKQPLCQVRQMPPPPPPAVRETKVDCHDHHTQVGDHCYEFSHESEHFDHFYEECSKDDKQPFYPESCEEFTHMAHHLETMNDQRSYWVGAEDTSGFHEWTWSDGENIPGGAPYWAYDQPTHLATDAPRKFCGVMDSAERYYLSDDNRDAKHSYICKVSPRSGPPY